MISDILSEACDQIRAFAAENPGTYDGSTRAHIERVVKAMDDLRQALDTAPDGAERMGG